VFLFKPGSELANEREEFSMPDAECRHIHPNGRKCNAAALKGMPYCYYHDRLHRAIVKQPSPSDTGVVDIPEIEDGITLQMALSRVIRALAANKLDPVRAGRILYGLQIVAQSQALSNAFSPSISSVESVTLSDSGEELGPEIFDCDDVENCNCCPFKHNCDDFDGSNDNEEGPEDDPDDEEDEEEEDDDDDDKGTAEQLVADAKISLVRHDALDAGPMRQVERLLKE
jgi:hypothetical protein